MTHVPTIREAVGIFHSNKDLQGAIDDLLTHGFDRAELSLLASSDVVEEQLGHAYRKVADIEDDAAAPRIAYIADEDIGDAEGAVLGGFFYVGAMAGLIPVVASGGAVAAALLAMVIGGGSGAAIGGVLARIIHKRHANYIADQIDHGGLVLWVRTWNTGDEERAVRILKAHSAGDVHLHGLPSVQSALEQKYLGAISPAEREASGNVQDIRGSDGEYYAAGRVFADPREAEAYRKRLAYIESLQLAAVNSGFDLTAALRDPPGVFGTPNRLVDTHLPARLKLEILRRWAYDARTLQIAESEGMRGPAPESQLQDIELAIAQIENSQSSLH